MATDHDWPVLLSDYKVALERFEQISRALTTALVNGDTEAAHELVATETLARDAVVAGRARLLDAWRDSERTSLELHALLGVAGDKPA